MPTFHQSCWEVTKGTLRPCVLQQNSKIIFKFNIKKWFLQKLSYTQVQSIKPELSSVVEGRGKGGLSLPGLPEHHLMTTYLLNWHYERCRSHDSQGPGFVFQRMKWDSGWPSWEVGLGECCGIPGLPLALSTADRSIWMGTTCLSSSPTWTQWSCPDTQKIENLFLLPAI